MDHPIQRMGIILTLGALIATLQTDPTHGTSAKNVDPLQGIDNLGIVVQINRPIRFDDPNAHSLFGRRHDAASAFKDDLKKRVRERLEPRGISVSTDSQYTLFLSYFGGYSDTVDRGDQGIALLEVTITYQREAGQRSEEIFSRVVVGTIDRDRPEPALMAAADYVIGDLITDGDIE